MHFVCFAEKLQLDNFVSRFTDLQFGHFQNVLSFSKSVSFILDSFKMRFHLQSLIEFVTPTTITCRNDGIFPFSIFNVCKSFTYVFELERDLSPADAKDFLCFLPNCGFVWRKGTVCWPLPQDSKSWFSCLGVCTLMMGGTLLASATGRQFDSWVFVEIIQIGS